MPDPLARFNIRGHEADRMCGSVVGEPIAKMSEGQFFEQLSKQPKGPFVEQSIETADLLTKTKAVRRPGETVLALVARCGIAPGQIRDWDEIRIQKFCDQQPINRIDDDAIVLTLT
jgi:hypothetical protein